MLRVIIIYAVIGSVAYFIISEIIKYLGAINGGRHQMDRDALRFKDRLKEYIIEPWPWDDLKLLSYETEFNQSSRIFGNVHEGHFTTIYQETIAAFVAKQYGDRTLVCIREDAHQYVLTLRGDDFRQLVIDEGQPLSIQQDSRKMSVDEGRIELTSNDDYCEIRLEGKPIIRTSPLDESGKSNQRVISLLSNGISEVDRLIVKFLLLFCLICDTVLKQKGNSA